MNWEGLSTVYRAGTKCVMLRTTTFSQILTPPVVSGKPAKETRAEGKRSIRKGSAMALRKNCWHGITEGYIRFIIDFILKSSIGDQKLDAVVCRDWPPCGAAKRDCLRRMKHPETKVFPDIDRPNADVAEVMGLATLLYCH